MVVDVPLYLGGMFHCKLDGADQILGSHAISDSHLQPVSLLVERRIEPLCEYLYRFVGQPVNADRNSEFVE
ncbi:hypothetical protein [Devosia sp. MC521]|uniref:hypothetical protein n=1 Tax=Devosia sp. MC521 TaxID=2759954 RepID=UPI0015FB8B8F|nr:hypothetical protein [Devosia sp. MC521]MBJ6988969.1 hypothetical protein [Devosia sp. MC521]QMW64402.1 hypothetical protein H4N61_08935 [Devosia sp. MC521]